ncbi:protein of unknown function [Methylacidimicrobium sp. AP8]|nr:protein of unknown function [Methylacidimicrobium sp. AP8]
MQNGLVCLAPAWFSILAVCLHTAPVENLRPPCTQAHLRRLGYETWEKWPLAPISHQYELSRERGAG